MIHIIAITQLDETDRENTREKQLHRITEWENETVATLYPCTSYR